jgi:hypothetical protein
MPGYAPQSAYRSFIGLAKDTTNANLNIAHAVGATALTLRSIVQLGTLLTVSGATVSAVIVDGPLSETVACSGNATGTVDGSTIACGATGFAHSPNVYVYFQVTASIGPTAYIPVTKIDFSDKYNQLGDVGFRGSQAKTYGFQQGMRLGNFVIDGDLFADSFGYVLGSFFGAYDYLATNGSTTSTTYSFSPQNTGNGQPTPYLFYDFNPGGGNMRVFAKAVISDLTIKFNPAALVSYSATGMSFASGVVATPTPAFSTFTPVPSRVATTTVNSLIIPSAVSADYTFKREMFGEINTLQGGQDPLAIFSGPVSLVTKFALVQGGDDTQLNYYINQTQPPFVLTGTRGLTTAVDGLRIQCTSANYQNVKLVQQGKAYVELNGEFEAIANATDRSTAGGGYSPALVTLSTKSVGGATQY